MWVCGLKLDITCRACADLEVTPYVGVWIETLSHWFVASVGYVTPYVGVWIETFGFRTN